MTEWTNAPLRVLRLIATRSGDADRGSALWINPDDARRRLLMDGELVWVHGPRRHELATLHYDDEMPRGDVVLRDIAGASPSEIVTLVKVDTDSPPRRRMLA